MKITITLADLNAVVGNLNKIIEAPISAKYAYKLGRAARFFREELHDLQRQVNDLAIRYGIQEGDNVRVPPDKMPAFQKEYDDLVKEKISFDFEPLPLSVFGELKLAARDMAWLEDFFYDDDATKNVEGEKGDSGSLAQLGS